MWQEEPTSSMSYLAMKVSDRPLLVGDLLGRVLVDGVAVGHLERLGVEQVDLVLALAGLALGELDGHARGLHAVADVADDVLIPGVWRMW